MNNREIPILPHLACWSYEVLTLVLFISIIVLGFKASLFPNDRFCFLSSSRNFCAFAAIAEMGLINFRCWRS